MEYQRLKFQMVFHLVTALPEASRPGIPAEYQVDAVLGNLSIIYYSIIALS